jgi:hypothetical protein
VTYVPIQFHQLHCLNRMRKTFVELHHRTATARDHVHMEHCLSYIRQMVLCAADTSLEPSRRVNLSDGTQRSESWSDGTIHECRDWGQLMDWAETNYVTWKDTALSGPPDEPGLPVDLQ